MAPQVVWRLRAATAVWIAAAGFVVLGLRPAPRAVDKTASLVGRWTLDRAHSQMPDEVGFDLAVETATESPENANAETGRRRGGRTDGSGQIPIAPEGEQTLKIIADVTDEAQHPWPTLAISADGDLVLITDGGTQTRRVHPGKDDEQRLADGGITTHSKWDKATLVVDYEVEKDRDVRYTYARVPDSASLLVEVTFRDHGHGVPIRRVYTQQPAVPGITPRKKSRQAPVSG